MKLHILAAGTLALCVGAGAGAQKIYRCGPDGRVYQQAPCADGRAIDASDPRTADQREAAQAAARSEARLAAQLDRNTSASATARGGKTKPPAAADKPASNAASKKAAPEAKPLVILPPLKPKPAASASTN